MALQIQNYLAPSMAWLRSDGRHFQIISQVAFLCYGIFSLGWDADWKKYAAAFGGCLFAQFLAIRFAGVPTHSMKSAMITSLGLSLLMKANSPWLFLFAAFFAIGQKFMIKIKGKHLWNPANFGIVVIILLSGEAWISPGQWGSGALLVFIIGTAGLAVLSNIRRLDTGITFMITLAILEYGRTIYYIGWGWDVLLLKLSSGSLWLFALFMITDPMTTPNARSTRIIWSVLVATASFYLANFKFINGAPFWVLFFATPLTPFFDFIVKKPVFTWLKTKTLQANQLINFSSMKKTLPLILVALLFIPAQRGSSFCGFYVAKADAKLFNNKSEVIMVRDGIHNVITMSSDFQGNLKDFAMVIPVPVVLGKNDIRVIERRIFDVLNDYSAPRVVEYYDENPCGYPAYEDMVDYKFPRITEKDNIQLCSVSATSFGVTIEAQYKVDEYDILILSAKESTGLRDWLILNDYKIPAAANEVLDPYVKSNMKFFLVKVNLEEMKNKNFDYLRPIQISFDHAKYMLPLRLGMANSQGSQDMIVYAFTKTGRVECTNYRTVKLPTDRNVPLYIQPKFGEFYKALFEKSYLSEGRNAVFLEYAWNVSPYNSMHCDPCVGPPPINQDFVEAGVNWLNGSDGQPVSIFFTRLHVRYTRSKFPADLQFQATPNNENFQCRYILTHPANGNLSCDAGQEYIQTLYDRRRKEIDEVFALTGWSAEGSDPYLNEFNSQIKTKTEEKKESAPFFPKFKLPENTTSLLTGISVLLLVSLVLFRQQDKGWLKHPTNN